MVVFASTACKVMLNPSGVSDCPTDIGSKQSLNYSVDRRLRSLKFASVPSGWRDEC